VTGKDTTAWQPFIKHWDGTRWRNISSSPTRYMRGLRSVGLTVTTDGSIAALETTGRTARTNVLSLRCSH
jgi:hypothetical protein